MNIQPIIDFVKENWQTIVVIWLALIKFITAIRDAIDKTPSTDDNVFERFCTILNKVGAQLFTGQRAKPEVQ